MAIHPVVRPVEASEARRIQVLAGLWPVHYREAFAVQVDVEHDPEAWARLLLEGATASKRARMRSVWTRLGIELAPPGAEGHVLDWRVVHSGDDAVVLGARSRTGLTARIVLAAPGRRVVHTMVVRYDRWSARPLWFALARGHRAFVRGLLEDLVARAGARGGTDDVGREDR